VTVYESANISYDRPVLRRAFPAVCAIAIACALTGTASAASVTTLHVGDTFIVSGVTGSRPGEGVKRATGAVVVRGRWGGGAWYVVTTTRTDANGRYRFKVVPRRRGQLTLRVSTPDRRVRRFVLRVR
jgi:hypothetical protein